MKDKKIKYKLILNADKYIIGFCDVVEGDYDYEGQLPDDADLCNGWYKYVNNKFVLDEKKKSQIIDEKQKEAEKPSRLDVIEAQTFYSAMMTDTLLEEV